jgi:hypothetical protein
MNMAEHIHNVRVFMRRGVVEFCENGMVYSRPMTVTEWSNLKAYVETLDADARL